MILPAGVLQAASFEEALALLGDREDVADIFIIGGGVVFAQALRHKDCHKIYLTKIIGDFLCDVFSSPIHSDFKLVRASEELKEGNVVFQFLDFEKD